MNHKFNAYFWYYDLQLSETYDKDSIADTIHYQILMDYLTVSLEKDKLITKLDISSAYVYIELETELYIMILPHIEQPG